jgi:hypothetical protein
VRAVNIQPFAKILIAIGVICIATGLFVMALGRVPLLFRLPGDIYIKRKNFTFYFPLATSIIVSAVISLVLIFIGKIKK